MPSLHPVLSGIRPPGFLRGGLRKRRNLRGGDEVAVLLTPGSPLVRHAEISEGNGGVRMVFAQGRMPGAQKPLLGVVAADEDAVCGAHFTHVVKRALSIKIGKFNFSNRAV